jgi:hypothetical protein
LNNKRYSQEGYEEKLLEYRAKRWKVL